MNAIKINALDYNQHTLVPNWFINHYMCNSNGDFIKVYIMLLKYLSTDHDSFTTEKCADQLCLTESDVERALRFWASKGLLKLEEKEKEICSVFLLDPTTASSAPAEVCSTVEPSFTQKPQYRMEELSSFAASNEYKDLIYVTGRYLGKNLTQTDLALLVGLHDWLKLPFDVIEWLIEYCASNDHRNMRYIERVAIDWADQGITSLEKAKIHTETYNKKYFSIIKALGFSGRNPVLFEINMMDKWIHEFKFDLEIILEACNRTMKQAPNGGFNYTDGILSQWNKKGVKTLKEIEALDKEHRRDKSPVKKVTNIQKNKFINYDQKEYDYDKIEKKALEMVLKENKERGFN